MTTASAGVLYNDLFLGNRSYSATDTSNSGHNWNLTDTSSAGSPTVATVATGRGVAIDMDTQAEAQNLCLDHGNVLAFDIDNIIDVTIDVAMNQAAVDATTMFAIGLASERNDAIDTIAEAALFRVVGSGSTTALVVETDDGTNNNDDVATGTTLINVNKQLKISFAAGKSDVRFFVDGQPVATGTTFDMSNYALGLQPYIQLQKTSDANANGVTVTSFKVRGRTG